MSTQEGYDRIGAFLLELVALSNKHGVAVGGCGCCGSPWLSTHTLNASGERAPVSRDVGGYSVDEEWPRADDDRVQLNNLEWRQP